jgi:hypothetical protein
MGRKCSLAITAVFLTLMLASAGYGEERRQWVPNSYSLTGDMWTFNCPAGGSVQATVQTVDDHPGSSDLSAIDPAFTIRGAAGNFLALGDDEVACDVAQACGFSCPSATVACGAGGMHSIQVYSTGANSALNAECAIGGGYILTLNVFTKAGVPLSPAAVNLGGGPTRTVPGWAVTGGAAKRGPLLDDERLPF